MFSFGYIVISIQNYSNLLKMKLNLICKRNGTLSLAELALTPICQNITYILVANYSTKSWAKKSLNYGVLYKMTYFQVFQFGQLVNNLHW